MLIVLPFSCQEDEVTEIDNQVVIKTAFQRKNVSYTEYVDAVNGIRGFEKAPGIDTNRNPTDFIIEVDTENIVAYTVGDITTYTLRVYTQTDGPGNFTNGIVKVKDGQVDSYIVRYIPSSTYINEKKESTNGYITYDGLLQLLAEDGTLIFEQQLINGESQRVAENCVPHILGDGGYWRCASGVKYHSPENCVGVGCTRCDDEFTWHPGNISINFTCSGGGGNGNNDNDNDTDGDIFDGVLGGDGNDNTNDNTNGGGNTNDAPDLPTEPVFGGGGDDAIEDYFNDYLCEPMSQDDINWAYDNHDAATEIWNYVFNNTNLQQGECVEVDFEERYLSYLSPCKDQILSELLTLENGKFSEILDAFKPNNSQDVEYNWIIKESFLDGNQLARTDPVLITLASGKYANTILNKNKIDEATDLLLAQLIMHEAVHAYLVSYFGENPPNLSNGTESLEGYLYGEIVTEYLNGINLESAQHNQYLRDNLVAQMTISLKEYGELKGYSLPNLFYEDLAWAGLQNTTGYQDGLSNVRKLRIETMIEAERTSVQNGDIEPKGTRACN